MANEKNDLLLDVKISGDPKELKKLLETISDSVGKALSSSISKSVKTFATNLAKDIQISLDTTSLASLKKPITIKLDTTDATKKVEALVAPLKELKNVVDKISTSTGTKKVQKEVQTQTDPTGEQGKALGVAAVAPNIEAVKEGLKFAQSLGNLGGPAVKTLTDIQNKIVTISKSAKDGILSEAQKASVQKLTNDANKLAQELKNLEIKIKTLKAQAGSGKSPVSDLEQGLDSVSSKLTSYGFDEKRVTEITKKLAGGVGFLKEQYNLLFDELDKGDEADLKRVLTTQRKIENATALAESRLKTLNENRDNISEPFVGKQLEDEIKRQEALKDKARKAEIQGERESAKIKQKLEKDYSDLVNRLAKERLEQKKSENERNRQAYKEQAENEKKAQTARDIRGLRSSDLNKANLESVAEQLRAKRKTISVDNDIPINVLNKQTRQYDSTVVRLENDLENLNREYDAGNISVEEAAKKYKKLQDELKKLKIGIDNIDTKRLASEFNQEEADPRRLSYRLGILAFTLNSVGASLTNFSRNFFQIFDQLGQAAAPIERLTSNLRLQVQQQKLTGNEQVTILKRLREIGDLPGSSVEDANATFNSLQKINLSLKDRLALTEGIAKLSASPGGTDESAKQLADTLAAISLEKVVDEDRFKTLRKSGGLAVTSVIDRLGFGGGKDIEKFGIGKFIREVASELSTLDAPVSTTADRLNRLKSRLSELGVIFGKVIGPGLDSLNITLRDSIVPFLDKLIEKFDSLSEETRTQIGQFVVSIPVIAGLAGGFITLAGSIGFAVSGLRQIQELFKFINFTKFTGFLSTLLAPGLTTGAPIAGVIGPQLITRVGLLSKALTGLRTAFSVLTGPIGIAVELILSVFTALYKNTDNIRGRIIFAFQSLDLAIRNLMKSLGLDAGLVDLFNLLLSALSEVAQFIGGVLLNAFNSLLINFTNIINNLREMIDLFKSGDVLGGFLSLGKLVLNALFGLIKTVVVEVVAFSMTTIAKALENTIGEGVISGGFRSGANKIRQFNGSDDATIVRKELELQKQQELNKLELDRLDTIKQSREEQEIAAKEIAETLRSNITTLNALIEKTKDDFEAFKLEQLTNSIKEVQDLIKDSNSQNIESFKELLNRSTDLDEIAKSYNETIKEVKRNQEQLKSSGNQLGLLDALKSFRELTSRRGDLEKLYDSAEKGQLQFTLLAGALEKAGKSTSLQDFKNNLDEIERLASVVNVSGLGKDFDVIFKNIVEKSRVAISQASKDTNKTVIDYAKILRDLQKLEGERRITILKERQNIEFEARTRQIELDERLEDIRKEKQSLINERNNVLNQTSKASEFSDQERKARDEYTKQRRALIRESATLDTSDTLGRERIAQQLSDLETAYKATKKAREEVFKEVLTNTFLTDIKTLSEFFIDLRKNISDLSQPILKVVSTLFKGGNTPDSTFKFIEGLNLLIRDQKIPRDSDFFTKYTAIIGRLEEGTISTTVAVKELLDLLGKAQNAELIKSFSESQRLFVKGRTDFNDGINEDSQLKGIDRQSVNDFLSRFLNKQGGLFQSLDNNQGLGSFSLDTIERLKDLQKSPNRIFEKLSGIISDLANTGLQTDQTQIEEIFNKIFKVGDFSEGFRNTAVELIQRAIDFFEKERKLNEGILDSEINNRVNLLEINFNDQKLILENKITNAEGDIKKIDALIGNSEGKEKRRLIKSQNEIRRQIIENNYKKLDLEQAYIIQKQIIEARGNETEITRIKEQGLKVRKQLQEERDLQLKELVESGQANVKNGVIVDDKGNRVSSSTPATSSNIGSGDFSGDATNTTIPTIKPEQLSQAEITLGYLKALNDQLDQSKNKALAAGDAMTQLWDRIASGQNILDKFKELLGGASFDLQFFGDLLKEIGTTLAVTVANGIGKVIADALVNGVDSLKDFGKVIGDMLIQIGILLVQSGIAAIVLGTIGTFVPALRPLFGGPETIVAGAVATAAGAGMILLGKALGGGKQASVSNTGTTNSAGSSAGTSGQVDYDPEKDPKLIYQKALRTQVYIDIKRDDGSIVKAVVKEVNRNPAFGNLIGNNRTGFVL